MYRVRRFNRQPTDLPKPYLIFNPHSLEPLIPTEDGTLNGIFIDPGIKNFAIRIVNYDPTTYNCTTITQNKIDLTTYSSQLNYVCKNIVSEDNEYKSDTEYFNNLSKFLKEIEHLLVPAHYIVIESQVSWNYDMVRLSQHLITYLMTSLKDVGNRPLIIELSSKVKTRKLGAVGKMDKRQTKQWCIKKAKEIMTDRNDRVMLDILNKKGKCDDHSDVICMEYAWWLILEDGFNKPPVPKSKSKFIY